MKFNIPFININLNLNLTKKFSKKNILLNFLLILIAFNQIIETNSITRNKRRYSLSSHSKSTFKSKNKNKNKAKLDAGSLIDYIKQIPGEDYILFFVGFLSEFFPDIDKWYQTIKRFKANFARCYRLLEITIQDIREAKAVFGQAQMLLLTDQNKKQYCLDVKRNIEEIYLNLHRNNGKSLNNFFKEKIGMPFMNEKIMDKVSESWGRTMDIYTPKFIYCQSAYKQEREIINMYGSLANYTNQCMFFYSADCDNFKPVISKTAEFAMQAWGMLNSMAGLGDCIGTILGEDLQLQKHLNGLYELFSNFGLHIVKRLVFEAALAGLHYITAGIWGGLKGGYYLIRLGMQIKEFYENVMKDPAYNLGQIVGKAVQIIKSLIAGKRRRKFRKNAY